MSFAEAHEVLRAIQLNEPESVRPDCKWRLLGHGRQTPLAIVLQHGLTSCPRCFLPLGERLHAAGHTVLLPRLPHHGLKDRRGHDLGRLTPDELCVAANDAVDVGAGLGERVVFAGIGLGATVAAWAALHRADVHRAVLIAPLFAVAGFPTWCSDAAGWATAWLPPFYVWWDRQARDKTERPEYAYTGFSSRAGGAALRLGAEVKRVSESQPPAVEDIRLILNDGDPAASYEPVERLMRHWERQGAHVRTKHLPSELRLRHDFMSVEQPGQRPEQTYPALIDWLTADVPST